MTSQAKVTDNTNMKRVLQLLIVLFISFCFISPIHAQDGTASWVDTGYPASMEAAVGGDVNAAAHVSSVNTSNYSDFVRRTLGPIPDVTVTAAQMNSQYARDMQKNSMLAGLTNYIDAIYQTPPASTYAFVQDMGQTLGFMPKQAYAQGIGFSSLSPLLPLWKVFRNIAYALLAVVMMVVGFMVMFRKKIDPKTVVTVQNALPKIVVTLILITFSYAIVGLMIDLMYVVIYLLISLFTQAVPAAFTSQNVLNDYMNGGLDQVRKTLWGGGGAWSASKNIASLISTSSDAQVGISALLWVFVGLGVTFVFLRILILLLMSYIQIIISLLIAPLQFLLDAVPGGNGFPSWFKNFISNLMVFPITAGMLLIGNILMHFGTQGESIWIPPFLNGANVTSQNISTLIGVGILLAIPNIAKSLKESLKSKPAVGMDLNMGGTMGTATQMLSLGYYIKGMLPQKIVPSGDGDPKLKKTN